MVRGLRTVIWAPSLYFSYEKQRTGARGLLALQLLSRLNVSEDSGEQVIRCAPESGLTTIVLANGFFRMGQGARFCLGAGWSFQVVLCLEVPL